MTPKRIYRVSLLSLWLIIICSGAIYLVNSGTGISELLVRVESFIKQSGNWAPLTYILFYSIRSLLFLPATILTIIAGILFGPWFGLIFTIVGENISANISFIVGRYFMEDFDGFLESSTRFIKKIFHGTRKNGFMAVLIMRLAFLPFDLVGYFSGVCNIRQKHFALATLLGTIPGLLTFTLLGSSVRNLNFLFIAIGSLTISFLIALFLNKSNWATFIETNNIKGEI